jgi:tryptophan-rich sensory protein
MGKDSRLANYFIAYVAALLFFGVGAITTLGLDWYATLALPAWMPSETVVAAAWALLFVFTTWSACIVWDAADRGKGFRATIALYMGNALLVLLWNYLFFGVHALLAASVVALVVGASVLALMVRVLAISRKAALMLIPYLAWMIAALCFNYLIWALNP